MRIAITGASGRMGRMLIEAVTQSTDLKLTVALDQTGSPMLGQDACAFLGKPSGVLITDHNVRETLSIVNKAYILNNGKILVMGNSEEVANDPIAKKFYLGEKFKM